MGGDGGSRGHHRVGSSLGREEGGGDSMGMLYLTPGFSHSGGQENTGEDVTLVKHPVMEVEREVEEG